MKLGAVVPNGHMNDFLNGVMKAISFKALSHLDDLANVCLTYENLAKTLAPVEYVMGRFAYVKSTLAYVVVRWHTSNTLWVSLHT